MEDFTSKDADMTRKMPEWATHTDQRVKENRLGVKPINPIEFDLLDTPQDEELLLFIARGLVYVKRKVVFNGDSYKQLEALIRVSDTLKPWQFKFMCQHTSEQFTAEFVCVGEWIAAGKYKEFLR